MNKDVRSQAYADYLGKQGLQCGLRGDFGGVRVSAGKSGWRHLCM